MNLELASKVKKSLFPNETVLWYDQPKQKVFSQDQIMIVVWGIVIILFVLTFIVRPFRSIENLRLLLKFLSIAILLFLSLYLILRTIKKHFTWFVITDKRAFLYCSVCIPVMIQKELIDIRYFEVRCFKKSCNLYLGEYRHRIRGYRFDYEKQIIDWLNFDEAFKDVHKPMRYKTKEYLFFYDLTDPEIPAQIIRERTAAKEYIDPKRKKYRAE